MAREATNGDSPMILPKRRKPVRMGVREPERRVFNTHRAFVRRHSCCVPGCQNPEIEFAHVKSRGAGGHDAEAVSLCTEHHVEQHKIGILTFQKRYGVDLYAIAAEFARVTPDRAMREAIRELT